MYAVRQDSKHRWVAQGRAEELLNQALPVHRENRDRTNEAELLRCLADLFRDTGRIDEGVLLARQALEIAEEVGRPRFEADVLNTLGQLHRARGEYRAASHAHQRAIHLAAQGGADHYPRARGLIGMAAVQRALGALADSLRSATEGLRLARKHSFRTVEGHALIQLSATELLRGDPNRAARHAAGAIAIHERTGHLLGLADARHLAGHARGDTTELARAGALYHRLGLTADNRFTLSR